MRNGPNNRLGKRRGASGFDALDSCAMAANKDRDHPDDRRAVLLEEAARLFGARGYTNTSMRDIAAAFGVLPGSLYHHFKSKDELYVAVYAEGIDRIIAAVREASSRHEDPWKRLEAGCVAHLEMLLGKRSYAATVVADWPGATAEVRQALISHRDRYETVFRALVDAVPLPAGTERRYFRLGLLGALNWTLTWYRPGRNSPAQIARRLLSMFRTGGAAALAPPPEDARPAPTGRRRAARTERALGHSL